MVRQCSVMTHHQSVIRNYSRGLTSCTRDVLGDTSCVRGSIFIALLTRTHMAHICSSSSMKLSLVWSCIRHVLGVAVLFPDCFRTQTSRAKSRSCDPRSCHESKRSKKGIPALKIPYLKAQSVTCIAMKYHKRAVLLRFKEELAFSFLRSGNL